MAGGGQGGLGKGLKSERDIAKEKKKMETGIPQGGREEVKIGGNDKATALESRKGVSWG